MSRIGHRSRLPRWETAIVSAYALWFQLAFAAIVITAFGYRQFNSWTKTESCRATADSELLAFAPPRSFTPLWRFLGTATLYCLTLVVLYLVVFVMLYSGALSDIELLAVSGVTRDNAWLVALLIVTGLSPMLPIFSSVEQVIREVILASQPNKRFVEVKELGDLVVFLCSRAAASITGIALPIEGGWTAR